MEFSELVHARHSVRRYDENTSIDDADLRAIFEEVVLSPSSFNLQHWHFVVVRDREQKQQLRGLAYGQAQVEQCAALILVCGALDAHTDAARIYEDGDTDTREKYVPMIEGVYRDQPALQREEAVRSGALAAMSLMYAARNRGFDTGPMIGFDAAAVAAALALPESVVPVMMVALGHAAGGEQPPRAYRRPVSEVVHLERFDGGRLA